MPRDYESYFKRTLIESSISDDFDEAIKEWEFWSTFKGPRDKKFNCICTKKNIKNITRLSNVKKDKTIFVGIDCLFKFFPEIYKETHYE